MVSCSVETRVIHYWKVRSYSKVSYKVFHTLKYWYRSVVSISVETFESENKVRAFILRHVEKFSNMGTEFSMVTLLHVLFGRGGEDSLNKGKFKFVILLEGIGGTFDMIRGITTGKWRCP